MEESAGKLMSVSNGEGQFDLSVTGFGNAIITPVNARCNRFTRAHGIKYAEWASHDPDDLLAG